LIFAKDTKGVEPSKKPVFNSFTPYKQNNSYHERTSQTFMWKNNGEQANECVPRICVATALLRCRHCGYHPYV